MLARLATHYYLVPVPRRLPPDLAPVLHGAILKHSHTYTLLIPVVGIVREPSIGSFITSLPSLNRRCATLRFYCIAIKSNISFVGCVASTEGV